jgi:carboxypeptidase family protein
MRNARVVCVVVCALLCLLGVSSSVFGQGDVASVSGRVLDPNGAIIIEATVTAKNVDTGVETVVQTNEDGVYRFANLSPGSYEFTVSKRGFKVIVKPGVTLHLADTISLNFNMVVGGINETVTVQGGVSMINTTDASISTVVDQSYIKNMPLNGRSFQDLILLTPGIVTNTPQRSSTLGQSGEFSVNGQRTESNNYMVDGVSANVGAASNIMGYGMTDGAGASGSVPAATALGTTQALVSVDDLQEFRVESSTYGAQYGRNPGAQIVFETKSGTNQWHGTASEYLRNDYFDAADYFTNLNSLKKPPVRQNDFGGTLGGPVKIPGLYNGKDKTFFHVSYEGLRLLLPQPGAVFLVPDLCMRGDTASCGSGRAPAATALLPVVQAYPVPNGPNVVCDPAADPSCPSSGQTGAAQFAAAWSNPGSTNTTNVRLDHTVTQKLRLFFRFSNSTSDAESKGFPDLIQFGAYVPPSEVSKTPYTLRTYTGGANSVLSSRLSNDFRLNYSSNVTSSTLDIEAFGGSKPANFAQLAGINSPTASVGVGFALGGGFLQLAPQVVAGAQSQWNLVDTVHFVKGRHQMSFGVDYRRLAPYAVPFNPVVSYFFNFESDIEANTNANGFAEAFAPAHPLYTNYSLFVQDEWKATQRLSLSFGLRWDVNPAPGVTQGQMPYTLSFQGPPSSWTLQPAGTPLWKTTWFNFAPRLGAAYLVRNRQGWETVVRAGGGLFYDSGQQAGSFGFEGPGFSGIDLSIDPATGFPGTIVAPPIQPPGTGPFFQAVGYYPHLQLPYTLEWNASIEQAVGNSQAVTLSYVGSHAGRLLQTNQYTTPTVTQLFAIQNGLTSDYGAAQVQFQRRLSRGLTALGSYTWSHCLDYGSTNITFGYQRGNCDFDVRHNLQAAFSYDLPNAGHGGIAGALLHHWGIDDRFMTRTAFPITLRGNQLPQPNGKIYDGGLSLVPGQPIYLYGADFPGGRAINPNAFTLVDSGLGNAPRNFARGFGAWQMNLGVRREFPIRERLSLQFRAEAFNVFNHANFGAIVDHCSGQAGVQGCTNPQFGQAISTLANSLGVLNPLYQMGGPRSMQFALKLMF